MKEVNYLQTKPHPAFTAAEKVKEIAAQKRTLQQQCKLQEYQLTLYETIFPWLSDFKEISSEDLQQFAESEIAPESEYSSLKNGYHLKNIVRFHQPIGFNSLWRGILNVKSPTGKSVSNMNAMLVIATRKRGIASDTMVQPKALKTWAVI